MSIIGIDVSSNQDSDDINDKDIFQLEFDNSSKKWKVLASNGKYWSVQGTGVQAAGEGRLVISPARMYCSTWCFISMLVRLAAVAINDSVHKKCGLDKN